MTHTIRNRDRILKAPTESPFPYHPLLLNTPLRGRGEGGGLRNTGTEREKVRTDFGVNNSLSNEVGTWQTWVLCPNLTCPEYTHS